MAAQGSHLPSHLPISMSARPARLGLLAPAAVDGVSWLATFEAALAAQTRFWGGSGNLIFPLGADFTEHEVFWALADVFDPDAFVVYTPTLAEMERLEPKFYAETITGYEEKVGGKEGGERFIAGAHDDVVLDLQPRPEQIEVIRQRLAPLRARFAGDERLESFNGSSAAGWPFTDIADFAELPEAIGTPLTPDLEPAQQLLATALRGRVPGAFATVLGERGTAVGEYQVEPQDLSAYVRDRWGAGEPAPPWALSEVGLGLFRSGPLFEAPASVVVGDDPWDFTLFYALKRLGGLAWWLPSWLAADANYLHSVALAIRHDAASEGREVLVISTSAPEICESAQAELAGLTGQQAPRVGDWREAIPEDPLRLSGLDGEGRSKLVQVFDGEVLELDTAIPRLPSTVPETQMRWISEVSSREWTPIRHPALGERLLPAIAADSGLARTSREGVSYFAMGALTFSGASLEGSVRRPNLRPLGLVEQLRAVLEPSGWDCEVSDKGIYARESMNLFGGFDPLCAALLDPAVRKLLDAYTEDPSPGPKLSQDRRRYLIWAHFEDLLGEEAATIVRPLQDAGVLSQGVILKCARCRQRAWHRSGVVTDSFTCERCDLAQLADRRAWSDTDEPVLSYRLAEVLFQLLSNNGELPLLAAREHFEDATRPAGRGFELELKTPEGESWEVDIFRSDGPRLWIGEASKSGRFDAAKLAFLARLADAVNAYGVLLATSRPDWPDATKANAERAFPGSWPRLAMRAGVRTNPVPNGQSED
jgi:hypothetical protein